jgi:hypothetical protein
MTGSKLISLQLRTNDPKAAADIAAKANQDPASTLSPSRPVAIFTLHENGIEVQARLRHKLWTEPNASSEQVAYQAKLREFYKSNNPDKLIRVEEILASYEGNEEKLFRDLQER